MVAAAAAAAAAVEKGASLEKAVETAVATGAVARTGKVGVRVAWAAMARARRRCTSHTRSGCSACPPCTSWSKPA
eukprot:7243927-Prymnesium_polylepis.1